MTRNTVDQRIELPELLAHIGEAQHIARKVRSVESLGQLSTIASMLKGRDVSINGILTNRELEWAGRVTPVNTLPAKITGVVIDTEARKNSEIIGTEFPIVTFIARTLETDERLVGELHQHGASLQAADSAA